MESFSSITILQAIAQYIDSVMLARSENTALTYRKSLEAFAETLKSEQIDPAESTLSALSEDAVAWFATAMKNLSPATERLRLTAVAGFYEFLAAEKLAAPNLPRVRLLIRQRAKCAWRLMSAVPTPPCHPVRLVATSSPLRREPIRLSQAV